jgi:hypothetical protein
MTIGFACCFRIDWLLLMPLYNSGGLGPWVLLRWDAYDGFVRACVWLYSDARRSKYRSIKTASVFMLWVFI